MHHPRRVMRKTKPTSHACIKGVPGLGRARIPHSSYPALLATISRATLWESPVPCVPFIPHIEFGEQQSLTFESPALTFGRGSRRGTEGASLHAASRSRDRRLRGSRDASDQTAVAPACWTPLAPRYWAAKLLISALSRKLFAPYKNKTPASTGAGRRSLRTTVRVAAEGLWVRFGDPSRDLPDAPGRTVELNSDLALRIRPLERNREGKLGNREGRP